MASCWNDGNIWDGNLSPRLSSPHGSTHPSQSIYTLSQHSNLILSNGTWEQNMSQNTWLEPMQCMDAQSEGNSLMASCWNDGNIWDGNLSPRLSSPPWLRQSILSQHSDPVQWNMWEQNMKILGLQRSGYSSLLMPSHFTGGGGAGGSLTLTLTPTYAS